MISTISWSSDFFIRPPRKPNNNNAEKAAFENGKEVADAGGEPKTSGKPRRPKKKVNMNRKQPKENNEQKSSGDAEVSDLQPAATSIL